MKDNGAGLTDPAGRRVRNGGATMGILNEFKEFAVKGNAIDLAVGVVIGAAFGKIVTSLVNDVIMPPIGMLVGGVDFSYLTVRCATRPTPRRPSFSGTACSSTRSSTS